MDLWTQNQTKAMLEGGNQRFLNYCRGHEIPQWLPLHLKYSTASATEYGRRRLPLYDGESNTNGTT
eukprot:CAMPEP_0170183694 /NCGR_PEP_ID=MMETSP0040_2-20121228/31433_1 /TAXON_ID=641309 /ORGANISM="Lotharella oceanica, Strain CCMP622" /LENGTH=65 /DNA_ID=CAMNT_0010429513 /DNA_START=106 /DNA_END=300 /DNA_ORIENTATION=-